ncbi:unnamed protein product, partial [Mesorhabditis spiculigera]
MWARWLLLLACWTPIHAQIPYPGTSKEAWVDCEMKPARSSLTWPDGMQTVWTPAVMFHIKSEKRETCIVCKCHKIWPTDIHPIHGWHWDGTPEDWEARIGKWCVFRVDAEANRAYPLLKCMLNVTRQGDYCTLSEWSRPVDEETEPDADVWRQYYSLYPENVNLTEHVYPPWFSPTNSTNPTVQADDIPFETYYYTGMIIAIPLTIFITVLACAYFRIAKRAETLEGSERATSNSEVPSDPPTASEKAPETTPA